MLEGFLRFLIERKEFRGIVFSVSFGVEGTLNPKPQTVKGF